MKFQVSFKTPDALDYSIENSGLLKEADSMKSAASKFIKYGEYVTIEIDTETNTAIVVPIK